MTPARAAALALALALAAALTACGVRPTGVVTGADPATGLTRGLRLYFVDGTGLRGVSRPEAKIRDLAGAVKLLGAGPNRTERESGLTNLVEIGRIDVTGRGDRVTYRSPGSFFDADSDRLPNGQLVCTLARAQSYLSSKDEDRRVRPDDVQVTLDNGERRFGPYRCSQFLDG
ncbi:hypothetical protein C9F11_22045 [Streptomyces sp. YIM 121038]|uniref:hypothetical protein n=1 Tax=Streptomyces sp. YIM 121038 TaxID=2136401 RepID=UPI001110167C|nr:hypothetical protein [Streptomyces sp. YIM 121038]QCX78039.1 hypothetical protein C9F11_22045 [Streptomyces sp. YIM 121038]